MNNKNGFTLPSVLVTALLLPIPAWAETGTARLERLEREMTRMRELIEVQQRQLRSQARNIAGQEALIRRQSEVLSGQDDELRAIRARLLDRAALEDRRAAGSAGPPPTRVSQADVPPPDQPVGQAPPEREAVERPEIQSIANIGGVLTPKGTWILEPSLQFSNSQINRLSFLGVEILETFLIGILEAEDADRNLISPALTLRYGLTPRLEVEGKLPYIWRDDRLRATIPSVVSEPQITRDLEGHGIGDAELALHYQLNAGRDGWPIFIGNLRYKSATGEGPYDVPRNSAGIQTELPTGSGFHALEPSVTLLFPSDPAVFYANLGYLHNFDEDVDKTFVIEGGDDQTVGNVDPGNATRISFGMAYSINSRASFSLGYKHDFIQKTSTVINGTSLTSSSLDVGSLLLGFSHRLAPRLNANLNLELGVTADAPDVVIALRLPYAL